VADPDDLPSPWKELSAAWDVFDRVRLTLLYLFFLGVAVASLVLGTTLARLIGVGLLAICLAIGFRVVRSRSGNRRANTS
jgi:hypothetical protein